MVDALKEDILNQLFDCLIGCSENHTQREAICQALHILKADFDFIYALYRSTYINLSEVIKDFIARFLTTLPDDVEQFLTQKYRIPYDYAKEVFLASIETICSHWIKEKAEMSPEDLTEIILEVVDLESVIGKR